MKIIKYRSLIVILFFVLIASLVATLYFTDLNKYKGTLEERASNLVGREIVIGGDLEFNASLHPRILLRKVRLRNAPWGSRPDMLTIGKIELQVALMPLLLNRVEVHRLFVNKLDALVASNTEGCSNWALGDLKTKTDKAPDTEAGSLRTQIVLHEVVLENSHVSYKDHTDEKILRLSLDNIAVKKLDDRRQQWSVGMKYNETPLTIDGTTSYIGNLLAASPFQSDLKGKLGNLDFDLNGDLTLEKKPNAIGLNLEFSTKSPILESISRIAKTKLPKVGPIQLAGKVSDSDSSYLICLDGAVVDLKLNGSGRISQALHGKGDELNLALQAPNLEQLGKLGDTVPPEVGPVDVKAKLSAIKDGHKISTLDAKIGKSDFKGEISIAHQRKPMLIQAGLNSRLLDLTPFQKHGAKQEADASTGGRIFSDKPLAIDQLKMLNADINYTAEELESAAQTLRKVNLALKLDNGRLTLMPIEAQLEAGRIEGDVTLDASKQKAKPVLSMDIRSTALELGKFKRLKETMSGGNTKIMVHLEGSGNSVSEIMAGLNGETIVEVGEAVLTDGTINLIGGNVFSSLVGELAPTEAKDQSSSLECAVLRFDIKDGIARADRVIALKTKKTVIVGSGDINLKTEKIGFRIKSRGRAAIGVDAGELTRAVGLGGTLAKPKPIIVFVGTAKPGATIGAAALTLGTSYLAQKLIKSAVKDDHPCLTALAKEPRKTLKVEVGKTGGKTTVDAERKSPKPTE